MGAGELVLAIGALAAVAAVIAKFTKAKGPETQLAKLEELHEAGALSDEELASARKKVLDTITEGGRPKSSLSRNLLGLAFVAGLIWFGMRMLIGGEATERIVATITQTPIDLTDSIENVPASSWKAVAITLPYAGMVTLTVQVQQGNDIEVFLMPIDQAEALKENKQVEVFPDFSASGTRTFKQAARLAAGSYYVVLRDQTLGILSASTSDVLVKARLEP